MALIILKAIYQNNPVDFLKSVIDDIEGDMPKKLIFNNHHICEHCKMMMDERDPNAFHLTERAIDGKEKSKWVHYQCPVLKPNRP